MKIGIFPGAFDPVHAGHVAFARVAAEQCRLDSVYFLPETAPRGKPAVTPLQHRLAMLQLALEPPLMALPPGQAQFSVGATLPWLQERFAGDELTLLVGSDVARGLGRWPHAPRLMRDVGIAVGLRYGHDPQEVMRWLPGAVVTFVRTPQAHLASRYVRQGDARHLEEVRAYSVQHQLYSKAN